MLNNKGQSLVLFIIVLPILILILILIIDIGQVIVLKQEFNNISELVLDYGLDNLDNENLCNELIDLIRLNKDDIDKINVYVENEKIYIELMETSKGVFSSFVDISLFNIKSFYVGYVENENKRIESLGD